MIGSLSAHVTDAATSDRALVPLLYLAENRLQIVSHSFITFASVLNLNGDRAHCVSKVSLAL